MQLIGVLCSLCISKTLLIWCGHAEDPSQREWVSSQTAFASGQLARILVK